VGACEHSEESSSSGDTELVSYLLTYLLTCLQGIKINTRMVFNKIRVRQWMKSNRIQYTD
jgi:hypothetical protein